MTAPDLDALERRHRLVSHLHEWRVDGGQIWARDYSGCVGVSWRRIGEIRDPDVRDFLLHAADDIATLIARLREAERRAAEFAGTNTSLMNDLVQMGMARDEAERQRDEARAALVSLSAAETDYRHTHDLKGDGHILTGQAWDRMRRASHAARRALTALPPPAGSEPAP